MIQVLSFPDDYVMQENRSIIHKEILKPQKESQSLAKCHPSFLKLKILLMQSCKLQWTPCYAGTIFLNKEIHGHNLEKEVQIIDCNG